MSSDANRRLYDAFQACLDASPQQRSELLAALQASDPELGAELKRLLAADQEVRRDKFLELTLIEPAPPELLIGQRLDDYEVLSWLDSGGMGHVYRALQISTGREVAVKLIAPCISGGDAGRELVERFRKEIEATARLKHANIVQAFAAGEFQGRLYYVMELVRGKNLQRLLDQGQAGDLPLLSPQAAARYLADIADAIQHAHDHNILHRDLKPQNILVEETTDRPCVMDFGLATQMKDGQSQTTVGGPVAGTPGFMAPEQASCKPCSVATDVYGLGATLYCLLVVRPPFQAGTPAETQRLILDGQPIPPRRLNPGVPGDLEAIVLKCLEKNPRHRYVSAAALRDDLRRFLAGRPTVARPIGPLRRLGRWCRREPRIAGLTLTILVILTAAGIVAGIVAERRRGLLAEREILLQDLQRSVEARTRSAERAEANFSRANQAVADLQAVAAREDVDPQFRQELLGQIDRYLQAFLEDNAGDPQLRYQRASALMRRAQIAQQIRSPREAIGPYLTADGIFRELFDQQPGNLALLRNLAGIQQGLATAYSLAGEPERALQAAIESRDRFQSLTEREPGNLRFRHDYARLLINLGVVYVDRGRFPEALHAYRAAREILGAFPAPASDAPSPADAGQGAPRGDVRPDLAKLHLNLASLANKTGDRDLARAENDKAVTLLTEMLQEEPDNQDIAHDLALALTNAGLAARQAGAMDQAERRFHRAAELAESLRQNHPRTLDYQETAADVQRRLGQLLQATGRLDEAAGHFEQSAAIAREILEARSGANAAFLDGLIETYRSLGRVHQQAHRPDRMQTAWEAGIALCRQVLAHHPDQVDFAISLGMFFRDLALAADQRSDLSDAAVWAGQAVTLLEPLVERQPDEPFAARLLLENLLQYAGYLQRSKRPAEAIARWQQATGVYPAAAKSPGDGTTTADLLFLARVGLAGSLQSLGDAESLAEQAGLIVAENTDTHSQFTAARFFAMAAQMIDEAPIPTDPVDEASPVRSAETWREAALRQLQAAGQAGYFDVPQHRKELNESPEFEPLRRDPGREGPTNGLITGRPVLRPVTTAGLPAAASLRTADPDVRRMRPPACRFASTGSQAIPGARAGRLRFAPRV
jgi:eukaryotic-like serine/threonine-protein kinase